MSKRSEGDKLSAPFMGKELAEAVTTSYDEVLADNSKMLGPMKEYGFVVVTGILSGEEQKEAESLVYEDLLESIDESKMDVIDKDLKKVIDDVKASKLHWPKASIPGIVGKGFMSKKGLPQGRFAWKLRTNKKCKNLYKILHGDDDLVVSMDLPFFNPTDHEVREVDMWPHADQNITIKKGSEKSYQGILYVWDSTQRNCSNTIFWPKSYDSEYHDLLKSATPKKMGSIIDHALYLDSIKDPKVRAEFMAGWKKNARRIQVPAGGIVIFDSRTIHQGGPHGMRLAQTLCWEPRKYRDDEAHKRKLQAIYMGIGTTHWASLGIHHGASFGRYEKTPRYSHSHHQNIFPLKQIKSVPLTRFVKWYKTASIAELEEGIAPEYRDVI